MAFGNEVNLLASQNSLRDTTRQLNTNTRPCARIATHFVMWAHSVSVRASRCRSSSAVVRPMFVN